MRNILTIKDFKLFEKQLIEFRGLTVLAGSNSVGKSTVIQALLLLRTIFEESNKFEKGIRRFPIPLNGPFNLELGNTFEVIRRGKRIADSSLSFSFIDEETNKSIEATLSGDRTSQTNYQLWVESYLFSATTSGLLNSKFYYLCAERIGPRLKYEYDILPFLHAGYKGERTFQILSGENINIIPGKLLNQDEPPLLFDQARNWLDYIIPGASFDNALAIGKSRVIEGTYGESLPTNVGFGISYVLPIIVNGLIAEENTFLIVENPEAHLHPSGQSRIGKFLAQIAGTGVNVVIETHSEHVVNGIRIASLKKLVPFENVIVNYIAKVDSGKSPVNKIDLTLMGDLTAYPKGFFDQEQNDIATIITEKRQIN